MRPAAIAPSAGGDSGTARSRSAAVGTAVLATLVLLSGCLGVAPPGDGGPTQEPTTATPTATTETPSSTATPGPDDGPAVSSATATLAPGESATVVVRAWNVGELTIRDRWHGDANVSIDWRNTTVEPQWDFVVQTLPPYWTWDAVQPEVTLRLAIRASTATSPGTYRTAVVAWDDTNHSHEGGARAEVVVTVTEDEA